VHSCSAHSKCHPASCSRPEDVPVTTSTGCARRIWFRPLTALPVVRDRKRRHGPSAPTDLLPMPRSLMLAARHAGDLAANLHLQHAGHCGVLPPVPLLTAYSSAASVARPAPSPLVASLIDDISQYAPSPPFIRAFHLRDRRASGLSPLDEWLLLAASGHLPYF